jgi:large subunit ribosomal protein L19e
LSALRLVKRVAAKLLKVGVNRVWIDPEQLDRASAAITKEEVRKLIKDGVVRARPIKGASRWRWRKAHEQRKKGLRKGPGSRKGSIVSRKRTWVARVRALRRLLADLKERRRITRSTYRELYSMVKSGVFRSKAQLQAYIKEKGLVKELP